MDLSWRQEREQGYLCRCRENNFNEEKDWEGNTFKNDRLEGVDLHFEVQ